jgi:hypothetical protein
MRTETEKNSKILTGDMHVAGYNFCVEGGCVSRYFAAILASKLYLHITQYNLVRPGLTHLQHPT